MNYFMDGNWKWHWAGLGWERQMAYIENLNPEIRMVILVVNETKILKLLMEDYTRFSSFQMNLTIFVMFKN